MGNFCLVASVPKPLSIHAQLQSLKSVSKLKVYTCEEKDFRTYFGIGTLAPSCSMYELAEELRTIAESTPFADISVFPLEKEIQILKEDRKGETEIILH